MAKIQVTLDATKLRNLVSNREYQNKQGETVKLQEVKFELVKVKEPKVIYEKDNMKITKTHFACVIQTKEEREQNTPTNYIGEGFTTSWADKNIAHAATPITEDEPDNLPF